MEQTLNTMTADSSLPSLDVLRHENFLTASQQSELLNWCLAEVAWKDTHVNYAGRLIAVPRRLAWYGPIDYAYSGIRHEAAPMPFVLKNTSNTIENWLSTQGLNTSFNSVLLNCYRDGNDSIGMHSDDESQLEPGSAIASLSLGATRTFVFQHKLTSLKLSEPLKGGSLLVMKGNTQKEWRHGIPAEKDCGLRLNLTFRKTLKT